MNPGYNCPLGDKHCAELDKALTISANTRKLAEDCIDCGLPFDQELAQIKGLEALVTKMKAKFFPNRV